MIQDLIPFKIKKLFYESISGPLRDMKILLFLFFIAFTGTALLLFYFRSPFFFLLIFALYVSLNILLIILLQTRNSAKLNELKYQLTLYDNMVSNNIKIKNFYMDNAAGNASLLLTLFKSLYICKPDNVLEIGSGQTTKLLGHYYKDHPNKYILSLEQNGDWAQVLLPYITFNNRHHDYRVAPIINKTFKVPGTDLQIQTEWFDGVESFLNKKFNLVLIDGPVGAKEYSRSGILEYIPAILDKSSFIIIIDDAERYGEIMTIRLLKKMLVNFDIKHIEFDVLGIKRQYVFCSPNFAFLKYT